jgi:hypothetical protein
MLGTKLRRREIIIFIVFISMSITIIPVNSYSTSTFPIDLALFGHMKYWGICNLKEREHRDFYMTGTFSFGFVVLYFQLKFT